jgi:hypothetical protein
VRPVGSWPLETVKVPDAFEYGGPKANELEYGAPTALLKREPGVMSDGASPATLSPQHAIELSDRTAHALLCPTATRVKVPVGALVWPASFAPQHWIAPAVETAHADVEPTATDLNVVPVGGVAFPPVLSPQQTTAPSLRTAHALALPALTWVKTPVVGVSM